jgi:hypothetical protein
MASGSPTSSTPSVADRFAAVVDRIAPKHTHEAVTHCHPAVLHEEPYGLTMAQARKGLSTFARMLAALTTVGSPLGGLLTSSAGPETAGFVMGGLTVVSWVLVEAFHANLGVKLAVAQIGHPADA